MVGPRRNWRGRCVLTLIGTFLRTPDGATSEPGTEIPGEDLCWLEVGATLSLFSGLEGDFLVGLDDDEAVAFELHLEGFAGLAADEGAEGGVGFELGGEVPAPCDRGVGIGHDGVAGFHAEGDGFVVGGEGDHAGSLEVDVEEAAGGEGHELLHHGDFVGEGCFEGEDVVAVDENAFAIETDDADLLACVGEVEFSLTISVGNAHAFAGDSLLEKCSDALVEHLLPGELDVAAVGDHGAHLGIDAAVEVHLEEAFGFLFEESVAAVALGGGLDEFLESVAGAGGGDGWWIAHGEHRERASGVRRVKLGGDWNGLGRDGLPGAFRWLEASAT